MRVERHNKLSLTQYEGAWYIDFINPFDGSLFSGYFLTDRGDENNVNTTRKRLVCGTRLKTILASVERNVQSYPYEWELSGQKIVEFGYDFEIQGSGSSLTGIDLTEIAEQEVRERLGLFTVDEMVDVTSGEAYSVEGAACKLKITLEKQSHINHLAIDFFSEHPIDVLKVEYKEDDSRLAPIFELPIMSQHRIEDKLTVAFRYVFAKIVYLTIRQKNFKVKEQ